MCFLQSEQKIRVFDNIADGKGIIPYDKIVDMNSLSLTPENSDFFEKPEFYSDLKKKAVNDEEYESSLYLFKTLKMRNLGDMSDIAQNRFQYMHELYGFNPRRCNSASTLNVCIEREMSKVIIALPTSNKSDEIFEQTITDGFSSVNTRLALDTEILLPNSLENTAIDEVNNNSDDLRKDYKYKICYKLKLDNEKEYITKRVITKILKLDDNNQYGYDMTKLLPTGCIKQDPDITWSIFNLLLEKVSLEDSIGHLFIVDIEFDYYKASAKQRVYNEIYP